MTVSQPGHRCGEQGFPSAQPYLSHTPGVQDRLGHLGYITAQLPESSITTPAESSMQCEKLLHERRLNQKSTRRLLHSSVQF
ncbi:hypothetical protein F9C07_2286671 [Aspergillus flavus]|uniref:Uncharacterized protein n=1 Tax=Aspergillus flavus (strain ATCC 200026 / FGSC A1120 / IAM 13836 / NRRL 3357 / JCM 12722 / SRRC 167) TaxID=332952 RepID=A0A7U2N2Z8_ASPFN|nr:hypothetical protein F9C07_2286671 [Aspergillus flavus]